MLKLFNVNNKYLMYNRTGKYLAYKPEEPEYTVLDYLESTGTQWIDTEIAFQPVKVVIELCFNEDVKTRQVMGFSSYNTTYFGKTTGGAFEIGGGITLDNTINSYEWHTVEFTHNGILNQGRCTLTVDGVTITRENLITNQPSNFWLFNVPGYGTTLACHCKIRSAKYYNPVTNELIGDFIPVLDKSFTPCAYDKIKGKYHYNGGTGEFKWRIPNQLDYLESDGNQWIETGLTVTPTIGFFGEAEASLTDSSFETLAGYDTFFLPFAVVPSSKRVCMGYGDNTNAPTLYPLTDGRLIPSTETSGVSSSLFIKYSGRFKVGLNFKESKVWHFEDEKINFEIDLPTVSPVDTEHTITVFGRKYDNNITNRFMWRGPIYKAIFTDGKEIIMNLIPMIKSDGTACMYDLITKQYFENKGTGQFLFG